MSRFYASLTSRLMLLSFLGVLAFAVPAPAYAVTWTLNNVTIEGIGTIDGTFDVNAGTVSNVNITVHPDYSVGNGSSSVPPDIPWTQASDFITAPPATTPFQSPLASQSLLDSFTLDLQTDFAPSVGSPAYRLLLAFTDPGNGDSLLTSGTLDLVVGLGYYQVAETLGDLDGNGNLIVQYYYSHIQGGSASAVPLPPSALLFG